MTPKEKAQELIDCYLNASFNCKDCDMPYCDMKCTILNISESKQCALISVKLHLKELSKMKLIFSDREIHYKYWLQVKQELETI
jgi:hypothetical protein